MAGQTMHDLIAWRPTSFPYRTPRHNFGNKQIVTESTHMIKLQSSECIWKLNASNQTNFSNTINLGATALRAPMELSR